MKPRISFDGQHWQLVFMSKKGERAVYKGYTWRVCMWLLEIRYRNGAVRR